MLAWKGMDLLFNVSIFGSNDDENTEPSQWKPIVINDVHHMEFTCDDDNSLECDLYVLAHFYIPSLCCVMDLCRGGYRFTLIDIQYIDYTYYRVEIHLMPSSGREYVGDIKFSVLELGK